MKVLGGDLWTTKAMRCFVLWWIGELVKSFVSLECDVIFSEWKLSKKNKTIIFEIFKWWSAYVTKSNLIQLRSSWFLDIEVQSLLFENITAPPLLKHILLKIVYNINISTGSSDMQTVFWKNSIGKKLFLDESTFGCLHRSVSPWLNNMFDSSDSINILLSISLHRMSICFWCKANGFIFVDRTVYMYWLKWMRKIPNTHARSYLLSLWLWLKRMLKCYSVAWLSSQLEHEYQWYVARYIHFTLLRILMCVYVILFFYWAYVRFDRRVAASYSSTVISERLRVLSKKNDTL